VTYFDTLKRDFCDVLITEEGTDTATFLEATEGGLEFTSVALRRSINETTEELSVSFTNAYGVTLKPFHSYLVRPVFSLAMKACPYRVEFYKKLGDDQARVYELYERWLTALERIVAKLNCFYEQGGHDKGF
ncbi:15100_t:CDS:2, partial [Racocetra fulgida]